MPIDAWLVDSPKALSLDLDKIGDARSGCEFGPSPSRKWARCSVSKQGEKGFRKRVLSSVQTDSCGPYSFLSYVWFTKGRKMERKMFFFFFLYNFNHDI